MNTILIIDDSEKDAELLQHQLTEARIGNPVRHIPTCLEAMAYLHKAASGSAPDKKPMPAVIFMDLKLPVVDGYDLLKWLKNDARFKDTLVVALSGFTDPGYGLRAQELGANWFISKPCRQRDLKNLQESFPSYWMCVENN